LPGWIAALLPEVDRCIVDVGGRRMHVMSAGHGDAVLLLHGNPTWSFLWRRVAAELAGRPLRLVMPDLVGFGLSDKPTDAREHTLENHARWVERLLDRLRLDRVLFVGHDWGGPIGLLALALAPGRARGLVLTNTVAGPPREGSRPAAFHRFARLPLLSTVAFRWLGFPQRALHRAQGDARSIRGDLARAYRWPLRGRRSNVAPLALARLVPTAPDHPSLVPLRRVQEFVESFGGSAAIVWGDRDPVIGRALGRLSRQLPDAPVTHTRGGHFLQEEVPEAIAAAILDVAARAPA
jgi:haloalkane dehalogenase